MGSTPVIPIDKTANRQATKMKEFMLRTTDLELLFEHKKMIETGLKI